MKSNYHKFGIIIILFLIVPIALSAFSLDPLSISLSPAGRGAAGTFHLKNETETPIAIRISLYERTMELDGTENKIPAESLFSIYPTQLVLTPGTVQNLRIFWKGEQSLPSERAFRLLVEQVQVNFNTDREESSGLQIMFRYLGAVYVTPPGASPEVVVESVRPDGDGEVELILYNRGTAHQVLTDCSLRLTEKGGAGRILKEYPAEELPGLVGENILAGSRRRFSIADLKGVQWEELDVEMVYP